MQNRKSMVALFVVLALVGARSAGAQTGSDGMGGSGSHCLQSAVSTEITPTSSFHFDLLTRFRVGMFSSFSWGRGALGRPGLLRSSTAVLRERRGLMLR